VTATPADNDHNDEIDRVERELAAETARLTSAARKLLEKSWRRYRGDPSMRHQLHVAFLGTIEQLVGDVILNISCDDCRQHAVDEALRVIPAVMKEAAARAATERDSGASARAQVLH
jgi:hypothetical protein